MLQSSQAITDIVICRCMLMPMSPQCETARSLRNGMAVTNRGCRCRAVRAGQHAEGICPNLTALTNDQSLTGLLHRLVLQSDMLMPMSPQLETARFLRNGMAVSL